MFEIKLGEDSTVLLSGRLDAAQTDKAKAVFEEIISSCDVNFENLDYISSAGLSVLLMTQKRLNNSGHRLKLKNMNRHIKEVFTYAGFDMIFEIE
ncbi:MAG: STAS domain-containing protein [Calditrichaceae bacterium]